MKSINNITLEFHVIEYGQDDYGVDVNLSSGELLFDNAGHETIEQAWQAALKEMQAFTYQDLADLSIEEHLRQQFEQEMPKSAFICSNEPFKRTGNTYHYREARLTFYAWKVGKGVIKDNPLQNQVTEQLCAA